MHSKNVNVLTIAWNQAKPVLYDCVLANSE